MSPPDTTEKNSSPLIEWRKKMQLTRSELAELGGGETSTGRERWRRAMDVRTDAVGDLLGLRLQRHWSQRGIAGRFHRSHRFSTTVHRDAIQYSRDPMISLGAGGYDCCVRTAAIGDEIDCSPSAHWF